MEITLNRALKMKKKLFNHYVQLMKKLDEFNSRVKGSPIHYDANELLEEAKTTMSKLTKVKAAIHVANSPIVEKVFKLSDIKSLRDRLNSIDTKDGWTTARYSESPQEFEAQINVKEKDELVTQLTAEIEELQDELDAFNATTKVIID